MKALAGVILLLFMSQASGKAIPWLGEPFFIYSRGIKVTDLLNDLGVNYGIPVVVSPEINEKFSGKILDKTPDQILSEL
nr:hypothetical protein [Yersinia artesiana]